MGPKCADAGHAGRPQAAILSIHRDLTRVNVTVHQREVACTGEGLITVTHELMGQLGTATVSSQGLPGYTLERAPGESWRSRLDVKRNVIVVNNGHRDFVYASRSKSLKLRYLVRLYAKELVMHNFVGLPADQLLERMVELSLRNGGASLRPSSERPPWTKTRTPNRTTSRRS